MIRWFVWLVVAVVATLTQWDTRQRPKLSTYDRAAHDDRQSNVSNASSIPTWMIAIATVINVIVAAFNVGVAWFQWSAIHSQALLMASEQRPWVRPIPIGVEEIRVTETTVSVAVGLQLKNTGKSPAFYVFNLLEVKNRNGNLIPEHNELCQQVEHAAAGSKNPLVIFPDQATSKITNHLNPVNKSDLLVIPNPKNVPVEKPYLAPEILGCIAYRGGNESTFHHTWYSWSILWNNGGIPSGIPSDPVIISGNELIQFGGDGLVSAGRNFAD